MARAVADHAVDRVLDSFSRHPEFNRAFDECTYALEVNSLEPSAVVKYTHTALRQTVDLQFFTLTQAIVADLQVTKLPFHFLFVHLFNVCIYVVCIGLYESAARATIVLKSYLGLRLFLPISVD